MANLNKVMLIGRLGKDPEVVNFANGGKVVKFTFAVNNRRKNESTGQWEDVPCWLDVSAYNRGEFGKLADRVEQTLKKGRQIFIEGHLVQESWKTQEGQNRSKIVVYMDNFQYLDPKPEGMGGAPSVAAASANTSYGGQSASFGAGYDEPEGIDLPAGRDEEESIPF
jgi:single-strand DNA-binding protein